MDKSFLYAKGDATDKLIAAADEIAILPPTPEEQDDEDGQDVVENLPDYNALQRVIEEDESPSSSAVAVDSNADGDVNEGVKAAEAMAVIVVPSEGGGFVLEGNMAAASVKKGENETKQNNKTSEKDDMTSANQTLGRYKFAPLVANQLWGANQNKPALFWAVLSLVLPVTVGHTTACHSPALAFSAAIHFAMKSAAPCSTVLRHSPSSWAAVVHWSALIPKAVRSSRKHPINYFSCPPTQPAPPTSSPNITHFGSLVFSMRVTNTTNKIHLLRRLASMLNRVRLPNLLVVSCIRGNYIYMYWYGTAVCIGFYTRYIVLGDVYIRARFTVIFVGVNDSITVSLSLPVLTSVSR